VSDRSGWHRAGRFAIHAIHVLLWIAGIHYFVFWRPFVASLRKRQVPKEAALAPPRHMPARTLEHLGVYRVGRKNSFARFRESKPEGRTRVCALGDSFTFGDEVADGHDYPALLQKRLREAGFDRVDVLNFGHSWHGFQQVYMLWEDVGRRFGCDFVLLGPACFQPDRDTTFNHTSYRSPYYLHARYVLEGEELRLLEMPGLAYADRFDEYFRPLPRWQHLRYDRNTVPALAAVIGENRALPNPLYYRKDSMQDEARAIQSKLLDRIAADGPQVILLHHDENVVRMARQLRRSNLSAGRSVRITRFPYQAPSRHFSSIGNDLVADEFFHQLVEGADAPLTMVETADPPRARFDDAETLPRPLSEFDTVEIRSGDDPIGHLVRATTNATGVPPGSPKILRKRGVVGLLALKGPATRLVDATYAEVDFILRAGDRVVLRTTGAAGKPLDLGTVRLLDPSVNVGIVDLAAVRANGQEFVIGPSEASPASPGPAGTRVELRVGEHAALRGAVVAKGVRLRPAKGESRWFRVSSGQVADLHEPSGERRFDLVLTSGKRVIRVPIATWKRVAVAMPRVEPPPSRRLQRAAVGE